MKFPIFIVLSLAALAHSQDDGSAAQNATVTNQTDHVGKWTKELKTARNSKDREHWKSFSAASANKSLDKFDDALERLANGRKGAVVAAINDLKFQIVDADNNTKVVVPTITKIADLIYTLSRPGGTPSATDRIGIYGMVRVFVGVHDNKSYYVLNGAQNWVQLREAILAKRSASSPTVAKLATDLKAFKDTIIAVRDQLDSIGLRFVKGLMALVELTKDDAEAKVIDIQKTAKGMKDATSEGASLLANSVAAVAKANALAKFV